VLWVLWVLWVPDEGQKAGNRSRWNATDLAHVMPACIASQAHLIPAVNIRSEDQ
jgi:hypothetical protein